MAADWIKMRADLFTHPKVDRICALLGKDEFFVVGALFAFWAWADKHAVDGRVDGATSRLVDRATRVDGIADALQSVGWLVQDDAGISLPGFHEHNGDSAKERGLKNQRQARWRERKAAGHVDDTVDGNASTQPSTREEKRREEEKQKQDAPTGATTPASPKTKSITLGSYLADCEARDADAIPTDDPVFAWAETVRLPAEYVALAWRWFKGKYGVGGDRATKRYTDWRAVFRNAVKDNWPKYWGMGQDGAYYLTVQGQQAQIAAGAE